MISELGVSISDLHFCIMSLVHKHKPSLVEAKSWDEIEYFYIDLISKGWPLGDILSMIHFIKADAQLSNKLFACTSLDKLIISIYNPIELWREAIHIQYNKEKELWNFRYYPQPHHEPEHERNYPGNLLFDKFRDFVHILGW